MSCVLFVPVVNTLHKFHGQLHTYSYLYSLTVMISFIIIGTKIRELYPISSLQELSRVGGVLDEERRSEIRI